jgi:hypothetical protein
VPGETLLEHRETGEQYRLAGYDPLRQGNDPHEDEVVAFVVSRAHVFYLRPRVITPARPGLHSAVISGEIQDGGRSLTDLETGQRRKWSRKAGRFS